MQYKWFVKLLVVFLTVVSVQAETNIIANNEKVPSAAVPAGAKKVLTDDFSSGQISDEWDIVQGIWSVTNGALSGIGDNAAIVSRRDFGENVRLEYTCWSDDAAPCDLSAVLNSQGKGNWAESAFFFQFGGAYNTENAIKFNDNVLAQTNCAASDGIVKGKKHRVIVQKDDQRVSQYIDGRKMLGASLPPTGEIRGKGKKIAFYIWSSGCIDDVVVYALPSLPQKEPVAETNIITNNEKAPSAAMPAGSAGLTNSSVSSPAVAGSTNKEEIVFFDDFSAFRKPGPVGQYPESLLSELATKAAGSVDWPILGWEIIATGAHRHAGRRIEAGAYRLLEPGYEHCPIAPSLQDFTLEFDAKAPDEAGEYVTMCVDFRLGDHNERGYRLMYWWGCAKGKPVTGLCLMDYARRIGPWKDSLIQFINGNSISNKLTGIREWQHFRVEVEGDTVHFFHNGNLQGTLADKKNSYPNAGRIGFNWASSWWWPNVAALMLDNVRISAAGIQTKTVCDRTIDFPYRINGISGAKYRVRLRQVGDVYELYTQLSGGPATVEVDTEKNRSSWNMTQVLVNPYVRIEDADSGLVWPVVIFPGKIGSTFVNHFGPRVSMLGVNDHMGPVERTTYLRNLPARWRLYAGYDYYLGDYNFAGGPSEVLIDPLNGEILYLGEAMRDGIGMQVESPPEKQLLRRVTGNYPRACLKRFLSENHYFEPDEPIRFRADVWATDRCLAEGLSARFEVLDAFFQPLNERHEFPLETMSSPQAEPPLQPLGLRTKDGIGHEQASSSLIEPLRRLGTSLLSTGFQSFAARSPGVYHIRLTLLRGETPLKELTRAFEVVPPMGSDKTPAELSGLPDFPGYGDVNTDHYQSDFHHYLSSWYLPANDKPQDWIELANALCRHIYFNDVDVSDRQALEKNADLIRAANGLWNPKYVRKCYMYYWMRGVYAGGGMSGIYSPVVQQLVRDYLADPSTPKPAGSHLAELSSTSKWDVDAIYKDIKQYHWRTWIDYVNRREGEGARDLRASIHKINPKCRIFRYGHPMPCANNYIGLDFCRIGGKDFVADNITEDIMAFEGYFLDHHHSINRSMATMALQKMVCPRILIVEDNEGDIPCTADGQNRAAWPPNGIPVLRRGFQTKAMLLQGLSTIYFDGRQFHRAWDNMYRALYFVPERWRELIEAARVIRQVGPLDRPVSTVAFAWSWDAIRAYDFLWWGDPENSEHPYNPADENLVFAGEEVPRAGVVGGFVCRLDDIENLPACDTLVLPPLKGVKPALIEAIRKKHAQGVHLVGFQDVFGLEDLFGIEPVKDGGKIDSLAPADNPLARKLTAGIPEREVHYWGKCNRVGYRVKEATAILDARDESGRVIGPALVVMKSGKQAANAFWAVPPTDVWREDLSGWNISGETMSKLVKYLMGRVVREIATPPVTTSAGEVLAQWGTDGKLYVLSYENAYPEPSAPLIRPVVSINLPGIDKADVQCERAFEIVERSPGKLSLMTSLEPEAFALYVITPKGGMTKSKSKWTNIFGR